MTASADPVVAYSRLLRIRTPKLSPSQTARYGASVGADGQEKGPARKSWLDLMDVIAVSATGPIQTSARISARAVAMTFGARPFTRAARRRSDESIIDSDIE